MKFSSFKKNLREKAKADTRTCGQSHSSREYETQLVIREFGTFPIFNKSREQMFFFFLRLTLFTLIMANGYNFSIFTAID